MRISNALCLYNASHNRACYPQIASVIKPAIKSSFAKQAFTSTYPSLLYAWEGRSRVGFSEILIASCIAASKPFPPSPLRSGPKHSGRRIRSLTTTLAFSSTLSPEDQKDQSLYRLCPEVRRQPHFPLNFTKYKTNPHLIFGNKNVTHWQHWMFFIKNISRFKSDSVDLSYKVLLHSS